MGKPGHGYVWSPTTECIGGVVVTRGSETSQYPQEKKIIMILLVAARERARWLDGMRLVAGRGCVNGVVGLCSGLPPWPACVLCVSGSGLEWPAVDGESPVSESMQCVR